MLDTNADHTAAYSTHSLKATCLSWVRFRACLNLFFLVFFLYFCFFFVALMAQLVWRQCCGADRLPVVVRFSAGP